MVERTKKILTYSGAALGVAALAAAASDTITELLVREAMERTEPRLIRSGKQRLAGRQSEKKVQKPKPAPRPTVQIDSERVEISAADGTRLVGHWCPCAAPKRIVLAMHGWRSSWIADFGAISGFLHDSGCSVLYVEQRGTGESGGDYIGFGMLERYDCHSWLE